MAKNTQPVLKRCRTLGVSPAVMGYSKTSNKNPGGQRRAKKSEYALQLTDASMREAVMGVSSINFSFLGINLGQIPSWKVWQAKGWSDIGGFIVPLLSGGLNYLSMFISQKMNNQVATNADGEVDQNAAQMANQTNASMMIMMPLMSLWIGFSMPAAISIYWIAQAVFGAVQDYFLTKHYRKVYDAEDAVRQEKAALRRAEEAEKERQRQLRREQNPDGILADNVSKKKVRQQEKEAAEKAAREYAAKKNPELEQDEKKPLSGIAERPYCRGRAYQADHYGKRSAQKEASSGENEE